MFRRDARVGDEVAALDHATGSVPDGDCPEPQRFGGRRYGAYDCVIERLDAMTTTGDPDCACGAGDERCDAASGT